MTGYSSIFSSGLLATPRPNRHAPPQPDSLVNVDTDPDMTPTKLNSPLIPSSEEMIEYFMSRSRASSNASTTSSVLASAPRLRRRRSSLSVANTGLAAVKSPQRNASIALQRTVLMVPAGRARSGSTDFAPTSVPRPDEGGYTPVLLRMGGRSRSGSTGGTLR
ncbi:hypothetical protein BJV78DRAFT_771056 [Lactifluus subvellereus]|nr:hypothetical protein BJV78DRAFT_771056 [Lactifluus subvellereus]